MKGETREQRGRATAGAPKRSEKQNNAADPGSHERVGLCYSNNFAMKFDPNGIVFI